ncbi:low molecular weight phosphotyrosine protein phosphatase [Plectonema cf. radiosum LEGE 06105]|uniref:protein-tyrosine-phosphatase n=1 Tax=Plectonema cf. radiosum LEGE 06105 TaxID=945769 RepID=A0A8J7FAY5_9CYAN|nr:low molecular weight protein-tyrosine-phosphatase [Plectonema radiosum]MBE9215004.1 low molecular weight phosphotyrosine protein phosphatase [Plectonema cf. radiosum LEGE 06105]
MAYELLFVCLGNICRSPTAENVMNHLVEKAGLSNSIHCDSAGTSSYHIGSPPDSRMNAAANAILGIQLCGQARQFQGSDFENFDLILAMDRENYRNILSMDLDGKYHEKVRLICDYCRTHSLKEVPDPYYGGKEGFERVVDLLVDACGGLLEDIRKTQVNL